MCDDAGEVESDEVMEVHALVDVCVNEVADEAEVENIDDVEAQVKKR
jgi:hypothetical protein